LGPYLPLPGIGAAFAAEEADPGKLTEAELAKLDEETLDLFAAIVGWMAVVLSSQYALVVAFWAVLAGLVGSLFVGLRIRKAGTGAESPAL
jgi:hypothetical protein